MKILKSMILSLLIMSIGCDVDYFDNPNEPATPPTSGVFNKAVQELVTDTRDVWFSGRFTLATMQMWQQSEYGDEDRYSYRESMRETWEDLYYNLENLRLVIQLNEDEATSVTMSAYGPNEGQIATARIMMAWAFNLMTDTWGDIPYWSYGDRDNPNFQALKLTSEEEILQPVYATQAAIYADILNELAEAAQQITDAGEGFSAGDVIYGGDADMWATFANSLRLRIAVKLGNATEAADAIADGVFTSNADNAVFTFEGSDKNSSPMYYSWNVDARSDFAVSNTLVTLLKGDNIMDTSAVPVAITSNPFAGVYDFRLEQYAEPNSDGEYVGMPIAMTSAEAATITYESLPNRENIIDKPDYAPVLMEYAEVCFLLSEVNGWSQTDYVNGITASMQKWGVDAADITTYLGAVPAASMENVLTQKYIALYMDGHTAWAEYRRTGYPAAILKPDVTNFPDGRPYSVFEPTSGEYKYFIFIPIPAEITNELPTRMEYPDFESTLNTTNYLDAVGRLSDGNSLTSKLIWDTNQYF